MMPPNVPAGKWPNKLWIADKKQWSNLFEGYNADKPRPVPEHHGAIYYSEAHLQEQRMEAAREARAQAYLEAASFLARLTQEIGVVNTIHDEFISRAKKAKAAGVKDD